MRPVIMRARVGLLLADAAQPRHEVDDRDGIQHEPAQEGQHQLRVEAAGQRDDGDEVDADADHHFGGGEHHLAHRQRRLHHLGGDAAGDAVFDFAF